MRPTVLLGVLIGAFAVAPASAAPSGIQKIKHVIIITQENRSFDSYFGTFPGANGIPMKNGLPTVCVPNPHSPACEKPYPDHSDQNTGGPHQTPDAITDIDGGRMDGFIDAVYQQHIPGPDDPDEPDPAPGRRGVHGVGPPNPVPDVMGYHDGTDIPNYWSLAKAYVLQDNFYEQFASWSLLSHLTLFSAWAAYCPNPENPMSCVDYQTHFVLVRGPTDPEPYAWTDLTYLLQANGVSWACYLDQPSREQVPTYWNVLPGFHDVHDDRQLGNLKDLTTLAGDLQNGSLPAVSWILPSYPNSEHPPYLVSAGQTFVTKVVDQVMASPEWSSTAIFLWWDDWGGFYDHAVPPLAHGLTLGIRVPSLVISPYAKPGYIDHQVMGTTSYIKFIEDDFLGGRRLDPKTDGRPDSRPFVYEADPLYGDLQNDFDFSQTPRPATLLPLNPRTALVRPRLR